ncbi:MAG: carbohydrate binding domain-containing protein, partial [Eubacterium sp.]|nr:carbohydrate binding domain-containing protein [Eubacterium sp.]
SCVPQTIQTSITNVVDSIETETEKLNTAFQERLLMSTAMLTGAFGSYPYSNGSELFMMDNEDPAQAQVVWRWNANGFGKSSTGIDGPYTTALTLDDNFITNVISAMVIRGDLIEANSIKAESLSQSYKDEIAHQIEGKKSEIEQALSASNGELVSTIKQVESDLVKEKELRKEAVSNIRQSIEGLDLSFTSKTTGGINCIKNSSGLNGVSDDWTYTNSVIAAQTSDTSSGSMFRLSGTTSNPASLCQEIAVIKGKKYTLTFKAWRDTESLCTVSINSGGKKENILQAQEESSVWQEYSKTFTAAGDILILEAKTLGHYFYVADFMLVEGEQKSYWTPAPNEVYTENVKIDRRGINITNSNSDTKTVIDHTRFAVENGNKVVLTVNKDLTELQRTEIKDELTICKGKFVPCDKGIDFVLLD